jgi:hypothetical protein
MFAPSETSQIEFLADTLRSTAASAAGKRNAGETVVARHLLARLTDQLRQNLKASDILTDFRAHLASITDQCQARVPSSRKARNQKVEARIHALPADQLAILGKRRVLLGVCSPADMVSFYTGVLYNQLEEWRLASLPLEQLVDEGISVLDKKCPYWYAFLTEEDCESGRCILDQIWQYKDHPEGDEVLDEVHELLEIETSYLGYQTNGLLKLGFNAAELDSAVERLAMQRALGRIWWQRAAERLADSEFAA